MNSIFPKPFGLEFDNVDNAFVGLPYFQYTPLLDCIMFLTKRFNKLSDVGQFKVFSDFKGTAEKLRINDKVTHIWKIPTTVNDAEYIVKSKDFKEEQPY